jgi:hypothetical protein
MPHLSGQVRQARQQQGGTGGHAAGQQVGAGKIRWNGGVYGLPDLSVLQQGDRAAEALDFQGPRNDPVRPSADATG